MARFQKLFSPLARSRQSEMSAEETEIPIRSDGENMVITKSSITCVASTERLFSFWKSVEAERSFWEQFDEVFVCRFTVEGAKLLFPLSRLHVVDSAEDILEWLSERPQIGSLAILSPWISMHGLKFARFASALAKKSRGSLGLCTNPENIDELVTKRKQIHAAGYYEVNVIRAEGRTELNFVVEDSSVAMGPDGDFSFQGEYPGVRIKETELVTLVATRAANATVGAHRWSSVFNFGRIDLSGRLTGVGEKLALMVCQSQREDGQQTISAGFEWNAESAGHASLISCYSGPGDENMYAALLQPAGPGKANVSLWRQYKQWETLRIITLDAEVRGANSYMNLRFHTRGDELEISRDERSIVKLVDRSLSRVPNVGLRLFGNDVLLHSIEC